VPKGDPTVTQNLELIIGNKELAYEPQIFDYIELLIQQAPPPEPVRSSILAPEELGACDVLEGYMGLDGLMYIQAYKYASQIFIAWLETICRNGKPSPSSGKQHLAVAEGMIRTLQDFPLFIPVDTFTKRFVLYRNILSGFSDWIRIKFSREDYLLRIHYAHEVILRPLPDSILKLDRKTFLATSGLDDEYAQILCIVWVKLGMKPESWMMHFSHSEEAIRRVAQQRSGSVIQVAGQDHPRIGDTNNQVRHCATQDPLNVGVGINHDGAQVVNRHLPNNSQDVSQQNDCKPQVRIWTEETPL
jgi:hypothetical protein